MRPIRSTKRLALTGFACLLSGLALVPLQAAPAGAAPVPGQLQSQAFSEVGKTLHFIVPANVPTIHIHAIGGSGATGRSFCTKQGLCRAGGNGGRGGAVDMDLAVTAGQDLQMALGGAGTAGGPGGGGANGGSAGKDAVSAVVVAILSAGKGNGGGATYVAQADGTVIAAAAGGGGGGGASASLEDPAGVGGDGGDGVDGRGFAGHDGIYAGAGGVGSSGSQSGGVGKSSAVDSAGGGGGGGAGYQPNQTGGGAGGNAGNQILVGGAGGGGAGGHSFSIASTASIVPAGGYGDGQVVITWTSTNPILPTTGTLRSSANPSYLGEEVTFNVELPVGVVRGDGIVTIGTHDPVTGIENPQAFWDIAVLPLNIFRTGINWKVVLPSGSTEVWASYSGDVVNSPWKSPYLTQFVGPVRPRAVLVLPSSSVDFGVQPVGTTTKKTVTIENTSAAPWKIASTALSTPEFRWTGGTCGATPLVLNASCTIDLAFTPTAEPAVTGRLTLTDEVGTPTVITMAGSGIAAAPVRPPPAQAAPTVTAISPATGSRKGGTLVTITGTNLVNVTGIRFGSNPATEVTCASATTCQARSPRGSDRVNIRVTTPAGTSPAAPANRFRYSG